MQAENLPEQRLGIQRSKNFIRVRHREAVEVRGQSEILSTLDENGALEGLQFMPEMRQYCKRKFKVLKRVDKIIVEGIGMRRMRDTVILERVTCNGEAHGGCQRTCPLLWKKAWLKRIGSNVGESQITREKSASGSSNNKLALRSKNSTCQSTNLIKATSPLPKWDIRRTPLWDVASGIYGPFERLRIMMISLALKVHTSLGSKRDSMLRGKLRRTPTASLSLQRGDLVEVKDEEEILRTLDSRAKNRGLEFTPEMLKYCGRRFRVLKRLNKMMNEQTGEMRQIANTVLLEGVTCDGKAHGGCQRTCYCLWREIWLRRV